MLGYADCRCVAVWADDTKKKERSAEIRTVIGAVMRDIQLREVPKEVATTVIFSLPGDLIDVLKLEAKNQNRTLSGFVTRLLKTHSRDPEKTLIFTGNYKRVDVRIPENIKRRLQLRSDIGCCTVSTIAELHLKKELAIIQEES